MKKLILVGVNAKYIHSNLAIRCLKQNCNHVKNWDVEIYEITINDILDNSALQLFDLDGDAYGFSCYIWNFDRIIKLAEIIKKSKPEATIILGGPEVTYNPLSILESYWFIDYILSGEGEELLPKLLLNLDNIQNQYIELSSIYGQNNQNKSLLNPASVQDLTVLPFPYTCDDIQQLKDKIIYYESMRGCPFQCSYCLSSILIHVRYQNLERTLLELDQFIENKVRQVKFVDRTFNVNQKRAKHIFRHLISSDTKTNFHFEMSADLMDEEMLEIIKMAPKGRFQFEIGIQSTAQSTLDAITRRTSLSLAQKHTKQLLEFQNCHIHLDLIAGLPYETYDVFRRSFNETIMLRPHMLQLGFLKLLQGTRIRLEAKKYNYKYENFPPYEIISNDFISYKELGFLKILESLVDMYYNSEKFKNTLEYLFGCMCWETEFDFFEDFSNWWKNQGCHKFSHSLDGLYNQLNMFLKKMQVNLQLVNDLLKYDYLLQGQRTLPNFFENSMLDSKLAFHILNQEEFIANNFLELVPLTSKTRMKKVTFQKFKIETQAYFSSTSEVCIFFEGNAIFVPQSILQQFNPKPFLN